LMPQSNEWGAAFRTKILNENKNKALDRGEIRGKIRKSNGGMVASGQLNRKKLKEKMTTDRLSSYDDKLESEGKAKGGKKVRRIADVEQDILRRS